MFVKFIDGDRKGSIARIKADPERIHSNKTTKIEYRAKQWKNSDGSRNLYDFSDTYFSGHYTWDGRKNKVKAFIPTRELVFLPNYEGPTVWELFDHKAAKAEALKEPDQYDIDGELLRIDDEVLYINARYGYGMVLTHGRIKFFRASVDSKKTEIWTIVENNDGVESKISNSSSMIFKKIIKA